MKVIIHKILITFVGMGVAAIAVEGLLRLTDLTNYDSVVKDPATGLTTYRPNKHFDLSLACLKNEVVVNSMGFHAPEIYQKAAPDTSRIIILGNSFVEGLHVGLEDLLTAEIQRKLDGLKTKGKYEVYPLAFSANGTYLNTLYLEKYGFPLDPKLVVLTVFNGGGIGSELTSGNVRNHLSSNGEVSLDYPPQPPNTWWHRLVSLSRRSKLAMNLRHGLTILRNEVDLSYKDSNNLSDSQNNITQSSFSDTQVEEILVAKLNQEVIAHGAQLLIISDASPRSDIDEMMKQVSAKDKVPYSNIGEVSYGFSCDHHWDATGHKIAGDRMFEIIGAYLEGSSSIKSLK